MLYTTLPAISAERYTIFKMTDDSSSGSVYESGNEISGTVQLIPSTMTKCEYVRSDTGIFDSVTYLYKTMHTLKLTGLSEEIFTTLLGEANEDGTFSIKEIPKQQYFAVAYRIKDLDGTYRYYKWLKGTFTISISSDKQYPISLTYHAEARNLDAKINKFKDMNIITKSFENSWFGSV